MQPKLGTDSNQSQLVRCRVLRSRCLRRKTGLAGLFKKLDYNVSFRLETDSDSAQHILQRKGPGGLKHIDIRCLATQQWIRETRPLVGRVDTKNNAADQFTKFLDGTRTQSFSKEAWVGCDRTHGRLRVCEQRFQLSRGVSILSFNS